MKTNTTNEVEQLLEKYIIVKNNFSEETEIKMTKRSNFETQNHCDTYGKHGQKIGCDNACCYSFENSASTIIEDFYEALNNKGFGIGSIMDDENLTYSDLVELLKENSNDGVQIFGSQFSGMVDFYVKWKEENESHTEVKAWTYHDSHNFQTIVLETPFGEADCEEVDQELAEKILSQYPGVPHIEGTNASVETEDYIFHFDRWATNPWICEIEIK